MSIDERVDPGNCRHEPKRLYVWQIDEEMKPTLYGTCNTCGTDYSIPKDDIVAKICDETVMVGDKPFHLAFREAIEAHRRSA